MKNLLFKKSIPLILYTVAYLYFMVFNWKVFTVSLNVNLGFGVVPMPPFIVFFLIGFILIGILTWISYIATLRKTIYELEHGVEMGKLRNGLVRNKLKEQLEDEKILDDLKRRLGIDSILKRQEELSRGLDAVRKGKFREGRNITTQTDQSQKDN